MFASIDQASLFYLRYGKGHPIVVLHGGPGLGHAYLRPYLDALGRGAELIYYDQRGSGRSTATDEAVMSMTLEAWVDEAEALRLALKLPPWVVLGHGFGGFLAQLYARRHPVAVRGLVLVATAPALDYPLQMLAGAREAGGPESIAAIMQSISEPAHSDAALRINYGRALPAYFFRYQTMYGAALGDGLTYSAKAYNRAAFDLVPEFTSVPWLGDIAMPALVVAGRHDWWAPLREGAERLVQGLPDARLAVFEHSGHYPFVEETTAFCHAVRQFLQDL